MIKLCSASIAGGNCGWLINGAEIQEVECL